MSYSAEITIGKRAGESVVLICGKCSVYTTHEILLSLESLDASPEADIQWSEEYLTVQCKGCRTVSFCIESSNSEDYDPEGESEITKRLFPNRILGRTPLRDLHFLPPKLGRVYEETKAALIQDMPILAGIGIRAIVETVCNEEETSGRNLFQKISGLVNRRLIAKSEAEILHDLRFMGNEAAHKVKAHTREELNLAFDVVEHLLKTVYILPKQSKRLPKASSRRTSSRSDS